MHQDAKALEPAVNTATNAAISVATNSTKDTSEQGVIPPAKLTGTIKTQGKAYGQTGPKSIAGKNRSRWNALQDGATAKSSVLPFEDERLYRRHIREVEQALMPSNYVENQLVREYAEGLWRITRHEKRGAYERE